MVSLTPAGILRDPNELVRVIGDPTVLSSLSYALLKLPATLLDVITCSTALRRRSFLNTKPPLLIDESNARHEGHECRLWDAQPPKGMCRRF
jgi:hypothetical protein